MELAPKSNNANFTPPQAKGAGGALTNNSPNLGQVTAVIENSKKEAQKSKEHISSPLLSKSKQVFKNIFESAVRQSIFKPKTLARLKEKELNSKTGKKYLPASVLKYLEENGVNAKLYKIKNKDGSEISFLFARQGEPKALNTKIYFHAGGGGVYSHARHALEAWKEGYNFSLFSYRGYDGNAGAPSEAGLIQDSNKAIDELIKQGIPAEKIDIECGSFSGAVALKALCARSKQKNKPGSLNEKVNNITIATTLTSIREMARHRLEKLGFLPQALVDFAVSILDDSWNIYDDLKGLACNRVELIHSMDDEVIPYKLGLKVKEELEQNGIPLQFFAPTKLSHGKTRARYMEQFKDTDKALEFDLPYEGGPFLHVSNVNEKMNGSHIAKYGYQNSVDMRMPIGTPLKAVADAKVVAIVEHNPDLAANEKSTENKALNEIMLADSEGRLYQYMHVMQNGTKKLAEANKSSPLKVGDEVKAGQIITYSGHNGDSTAPHLHFSVGLLDPHNKRTGFKSLPIKFK